MNSPKVQTSPNVRANAQKRKENENKNLEYSNLSFSFCSRSFRFVATLRSLSLSRSQWISSRPSSFVVVTKPITEGLSVRARASVSRNEFYSIRASRVAQCVHLTTTTTSEPRSPSRVEVARFFPFFRIRLGRLSLLTQKHKHTHTHI